MKPTQASIVPKNPAGASAADVSPTANILSTAARTRARSSDSNASKSSCYQIPASPLPTELNQAAERVVVNGTAVLAISCAKTLTFVHEITGAIQHMQDPWLTRAGEPIVYIMGEGERLTAPDGCCLSFRSFPVSNETVEASPVTSRSRGPRQLIQPEH